MVWGGGEGSGLSGTIPHANIALHTDQRDIMRSEVGIRRKQVYAFMIRLGNKHPVEGERGGARVPGPTQ